MHPNRGHLSRVNEFYKSHSSSSNSSSSSSQYRVPDILDHHLPADLYDSSSSSIVVPSSSVTSTTSSSMQTLSSNATHSCRSTVEKSRESIMSDIEETFAQMIASISVGEPITLTLLNRKLSNAQDLKRKRLQMNSDEDTNSSQISSGVSSSSNNTQTALENEYDSNSNTRTISLNCGTSSKTLARYISVLQMIYEAIAYKIMVTKRDMYYRDVSLFGTQSVVDIIVDDFSCHFNVPRSSLNVSAASKGLVFGPILIKLKNNKILDCMNIQDSDEEASEFDCNDEQGSLIPPISQVLEVQCRAKCMIVIEKEATFRHLVSAGFCQSLPQSCILVTGKGYPDLSTRQFVKYFSTHFSNKPIFALMDNDPHGLDIYATYKWGARAMAFDVLNLAVNTMELLGLTCQDRTEFNIAPECYIPMTERDRSKCLSMIRTGSTDDPPGQSQLIERGWKDFDDELASQGHQSYIDEVNKLLKSDYKCELQALNHAGPYGLTNYLTAKLTHRLF